MRKYLVLLFCVVLAALLVFFYPEHSSAIESEYINTSSEIDQAVLAYGDQGEEIYKIYNGGKLIGVISDIDAFNRKLDEECTMFEELFEGYEIGLKEDLYLAKEMSYARFENKDEEIIQYLVENSLLGVKVSQISFSNEQGIFDIIYVKDIEDFNKARDAFIRNFVSEETLRTLSEGEEVAELKDFGVADMNLSIKEKISVQSAYASLEEIFMNEEEIYMYLCYGRSTQKEYYTVKEGDTLNGVGFLFRNMSPKQLLSINRDVLSSEDQILVPGTVLNVTYFNSPITVSVTKHRLIQEAITPDAPEYRENDELEIGTTEVLQKEIIGLQNILYEETWINGVLQGGDIISSVVVREPVRGVIAVGSKLTYAVGTGNFIWPVDQPHITCDWGCYAGHNGTDIASRYNRYGNIYAADSGVVEKVSYDRLSGNYCIIDHNNGLKTYYGHMNVPPFVTVGQSVVRGQLIGQIGMTGFATGPHVHFMIYVDNVISKVCNIMDCDPIR